MKKVCLVLIASLVSIQLFSQVPADTLIPSQHKVDTSGYEPKLNGGALIDTINTRHSGEHRLPASPVDTALLKNDSLQTRKKPH